jgi:DNA-binding NarL/FixJ family response regulator
LPVKNAIRVLVAEDEEALRAALADLVSSEPDMETVGTAAEADSAILLAEEQQPDVAIVDVRMPGGGAATAAGIRKVSPRTRIVGFSAYEDQATVLEMLRCGAVAYLVKGVAPAEIVESVRRASRGQASLSTELLAGVIDDLVGDTAARDAGEEEPARTAMDIHDDTIQAIAAVGMRLQILRRGLSDPNQLRLVDELAETVQLSISRLRRLLLELRPPAPDSEGL